MYIIICDNLYYTDSYKDLLWSANLDRAKKYTLEESEKIVEYWRKHNMVLTGINCSKAFYKKI